MITLKEWMMLVDYKITEGSDWYTNIPGLYSLTMWNEKQDGYSSNVVFDPKDNQKVYLVEICDYSNDVAYRIKLDKIDADSQAWDDVEYTDLTDDQDFLRKALNIIKIHSTNIPHEELS